MEWIIIIIVIITIFLIVSYKLGSPNFWKVARDHPDEVFQLLVEDKHNWFIEGISEGDNKDKNVEWAGPFRLHVPSLDKMIKFYGRADGIEDIQKNIMNKINENR